MFAYLEITKDGFFSLPNFIFFYLLEINILCNVCIDPQLREEEKTDADVYCKNSLCNFVCRFYTNLERKLFDFIS